MGTLIVGEQRLFRGDFKHREHKMNMNILQYASYHLSLSGWPQWGEATGCDWNIELRKGKFCINSSTMRNITYHSIKRVIVLIAYMLKSTAADSKVLNLYKALFKKEFTAIPWSFCVLGGGTWNILKLQLGNRVSMFDFMSNPSKYGNLFIFPLCFISISLFLQFFIWLLIHLVSFFLSLSCYP